MARTWFDTENTSGLTLKDLSILNRAARVVLSEQGTLSYLDLSKIRMAYKTGMSAREVADVLTEK